jgi:hypothetical protein
MALGELAFWGLIAWLIVILVRGRGDHETPSPLFIAADFLTHRLAGRETAADEYRERLEVLRGGGGRRFTIGRDLVRRLRVSVPGEQPPARRAPGRSVRTTRG